ncbi:hypothetical protein QYF61_009459 [Mycteria americana]|uniref:Uncharacterized protein n=1 Tax=Mycteria americana TaxID=33587 RepID=A0AAN7N3D4_MYCAM|nr:hypothetical protein QYF61_009459 [Mycteria americana]
MHVLINSETCFISVTGNLLNMSPMVMAVWMLLLHGGCLQGIVPEASEWVEQMFYTSGRSSVW